MKSNLDFGCNIIIDELIRSQRKSIGLIVKDGGKLVVRAPFRASMASIQKVLRENSLWIDKKKREARLKRRGNAPKRFKDGEKFLFRGTEYTLNIEEKAEKFFDREKGFCISKEYRAQAKEMFESWYSIQARKIIFKRVAFFAQKFELSYTKVRITGAKSRWGSCNSNGELNFSWRLAMAPPGVIDYVIVHELAHLVEMNHSRDFWNTVKSMLPAYKKEKDWLDANGHKTDIF